MQKEKKNQKDTKIKLPPATYIEHLCKDSRKNEFCVAVKKDNERWYIVGVTALQTESPTPNKNTLERFVTQIETFYKFHISGFKLPEIISVQ